MTPADLAKLKALCDAASPSPWIIIPREKAQSQWIVGDAEGGSIADCEPVGPWISRQEADANAAFIAAARTAVPQLFAEVERLAKTAADNFADAFAHIERAERAEAALREIIRQVDHDEFGDLLISSFRKASSIENARAIFAESKS